MPIAAIVADANVLLSAVIGKAALRVFTQFGVEVHAARFNASEVERYLPRMANKYGLPGYVVELQWRLLPVRIHSQGSYAKELPWAVGAIADRDADDVHPLALARALGFPLWSNDSDLHGHGVEVHTTAALLRRLEDEGTNRR